LCAINGERERERRIPGFTLIEGILRPVLMQSSIILLDIFAVCQHAISMGMSKEEEDKLYIRRN
jgi:hypothetical protein